MNPLDQLADVTTPEPISWWPLSVGHWIIITLCIIAIIASGLAMYRRYSYRKILRDCIEEVQNTPIQSQKFHYQVDVILKLAHQHYTATTAGINGSTRQWIQILNQSFEDAGYVGEDYPNILRNNHLTLFNGKSEMSSPDERSKVQQAAIFWLKSCLLKHVKREKSRYAEASTSVDSETALRSGRGEGNV